MPLPFEWELIDPFPVESPGSWAWSPDLELMVMSSDGIWYSEDGINWAEGTAPSATHDVSNLIWNAALSAYYGIVYKADVTAFWSAKSLDGITWSYDAEITPNELLSFTALACNGAGQMIAITTLGECFRSTGSGWTSAGADLVTIDTDINTHWHIPIFINSVWVVFNSNDLGDIPIATSPDAVTWTGRRGFEPTYQQDWFYTVEGPSHTVTITRNNGVIMTSSNGTTWTYQTELITELVPEFYSNIISVEVQGFLYSADLGKFVVFNYDAIDDATDVFVSDDGITDWELDSGIIPSYFSDPNTFNDWFNILEAPEISRFFGFAGSQSLTPVVTSPLLPDGEEVDILLEMVGGEDGNTGMEFGGSADMVFGWSYVASGGMEFGEGTTTIVLSADVSGMYTLVPGRHFDRIYTRNSTPTDTTDVVIPRPFGKTAFLGN